MTKELTAEELLEAIRRHDDLVDKDGTVWKYSNIIQDYCHFNGDGKVTGKLGTLLLSLCGPWSKPEIELEAHCQYWVEGFDRALLWDGTSWYGPNGIEIDTKNTPLINPADGKPWKLVKPEALKDG